MDSGELYNESTISNETCISLNDYLLDDWTTYFSVRAIFTILYSIIIFFGVGGNLCVIVSILRTRSLQTVSNYFIFSLSCSDLIVCLVSSTITPFTAFVKNWLFGFWMCSFVSTLGGTSIIFSTLTLTAISFDRFILICRPTNSPLSKRQAFIWIFVNVVIGITFSSPSGYHSVVKTNVKQFCGSFCYEEWPNDTETTRLIYSLAIYTLQFVLPLTIIISCYTLISLRLNERLTLKTNKDKSSRVESDQQRAAIKRNTRTNRMLIGMVSAFLLSQLPNVAYNVARDLNAFPHFVEKQTYLYGIVTHLTSMTSTIWNPFLYAALNNSLRDAFLQLMPNCIQGRLHFLKKKDGGSIRHKGGVNAKIKTFKKPYNGTSFANNGSELMDCQESTKLTNAVETSRENSVQVTITSNLDYAKPFSRKALFYKNLTTAFQKIIPTKMESATTKKTMASNYCHLTERRHSFKEQDILYTNLDPLKEDEEETVEEDTPKDALRQTDLVLPKLIISDYSEQKTTIEKETNSQSTISYQSTDNFL